MHKKILSKDIAIHLTNPSATDNTMAPINHSSIRIMVPVPNNTSNIDWKRNTCFSSISLETVKERLEIPDLESQIEEEYIITPIDWKRNIMLSTVRSLVYSICGASTATYTLPKNRLNSKTYL